MKARWTVALVLSLFVAGVFSAHAATINMAGSGDPFELWFDEQGNGSYSLNGGPLTPLAGTLMDDPARPGLKSLTYLLPEPVNTGDVRVWEDGSMQVISDILRFTDANGYLGGGIGHFTGNGDRMIYYSELGGGELADINGLPANLELNDGGTGIVEVNGHFDWYPGGNIYHGTSVPEPASLLLMGTGILVLAGRARRRKRRSRLIPM